VNAKVKTALSPSTGFIDAGVFSGACARGALTAGGILSR
jgi:hypothetical protein